MNASTLVKYIYNSTFLINKNFNEVKKKKNQTMKKNQNRERKCCIY